MMFQNRNFATADSVFNEASTYAPFDRGDTIPFQPSMNLLYYEGNLLLVFDTVFIYTREPVRQFTMRQLLAQKKEPVAHHKQLVYDDVVEFRRYYPHEEDVFIDMIRVVGGTFKMGSNEFDEDERPQTSLSVSSFLISKYEITNKLFCYFLNDEKVAPDGTLDEVKLIHFDGKYTKIYFSRDSLKFYPNTGFEDYPVVNVTWYGAQRFARFAVPVEEKKFSSNQGRLPSEVEWEYAARGGAFARKKLVNWDFSDYEYPNRFAGGDYLPQLAAFVDNSMGYCHQVGRFFPNELGIYDMSGNVWEWCYDKYNPDFLKRVGQSRDPMNLTGADYRVAKGGSWSSDAMYCRIKNRKSLAATEHNPFLGFRLWKSW
jgi:formylglycine-generating enzyme required for sulfatase activity